MNKEEVQLLGFEIVAYAGDADVYKRQTYRSALIEREKSFPTGLDMEFLGKDLPNIAIPHTDIVHNPVSYTHLDVYKRQVQTTRLTGGHD